MVRLIEIFHWMFEDERWRYKIFFQGLLLLVPVAGLVALLGWMTVTCENLLAGRQDLARAGLHLRRGVPPLAMGVIYWIGLGIPYSLLRYLDGLWPGQLALGAVAQVYNDLALLLYALLIVPVFAASTRGGFGAGLDLARLATSIMARPLRTVVAGAVVLIALVIGVLGFTVIVAAPFTITYAASVVAGIAAWWVVPGPAAGGDRAGPGRTADGRPVPFRPPGA
ncbi:MAG TPA: hypothetical protein VLW53_15445 [Candidatus Eisenbacteria bacterium]|nr:hypothetical protein [Candidatus Eisenbacteria bacterium]